MNTTAILVAAGSGARFGAANKVFTLLAGRPMVSFSLDAFEQSDSIDDIVLVAGSHNLPAGRSLAASRTWSKLSQVVPGGQLRQDSVQNGLAVVAGSCQFVAIHDAARPLIRTVDIDRCVAAATQTGAAVLAVRVTDTIKTVENERIVASVPRHNLWAAQTPQVFDVHLLREAFQAADRNGLTVTDDASLFEALGMKVAIVEGSSTNLKITAAADLAIAEALIAQSAGNQGLV